MPELEPKELSKADLISRKKVVRHDPDAPKFRAKIWECNLIYYRKTKGLSLEDISKGTGLSQFTIGAVERGCDCTLSTARRIADFFGYTVERIWPRMLK
jgi:DNA-binding XRE family transcriptional regulator